MAPFRYQRLAYVGLGVTDLAASTRFYRDMVGLDLSETIGETAYFRCSADHHNLVLRAASEPLLDRVAFELESEHDVAAAFEHVARLGLKPVDVPVAERAELTQGPTFRFALSPLGVTIEFFAGMRTMPQGFGRRLAAIERLGHVVLCTPDAADAVDVLVDDLNFRVSDRVGEVVTFMRCHPNRFHHSFALVKSDTPRLNHVNFMVRDIDDVGRGLNRLNANAIPIVYGPGRHPPSNSIFIYFLDPDAITLEYSFGMEEFPEDGAREARLMEPGPYALDYWGGTIDPRMGAVGRFTPLEVARSG